MKGVNKMPSGPFWDLVHDPERVEAIITEMARLLPREDFERHIMSEQNIALSTAMGETQESYTERAKVLLERLYGPQEVKS